jgi:hypothetical protein
MVPLIATADANDLPAPLLGPDRAALGAHRGLKNIQRSDTQDQDDCGCANNFLKYLCR